MTQTRIAALDALETVVKAVLTAAGISLFRNPEKGVDASHTGVVIMTDGRPGDPEIILSPLTYCWEHAAEFEIAACGVNRVSVVEAILALFEPAFAADRTLGGSVNDARVTEAPEISDYEGEEGVETERSAVLRVTLVYDTDSGAG